AVLGGSEIKLGLLPAAAVVDADPDCPAPSEGTGAQAQRDVQHVAGRGIGRRGVRLRHGLNLSATPSRETCANTARAGRAASRIARASGRPRGKSWSRTR